MLSSSHRLPPAMRNGPMPRSRESPLDIGTGTFLYWMMIAIVCLWAALTRPFVAANRTVIIAYWIGIVLELIALAVWMFDGPKLVMQAAFGWGTVILIIAIMLDVAVSNGKDTVQQQAS
jgi:uncharacterized membrane protein (DUF441 family)